jgi:CAAX prenyl protease-like protein
LNSAVAGEVRPSAAPFVVPFIVFLGFLAIQSYIPLPQRAEFGLRLVAMAAVIWWFSRGVLNFSVVQPIATIGVGVAVFLIWIAPDALIPGYRTHWLFQNGLTGAAKGTVDAAGQSDFWLLTFRVLRAVIIVPIIEELFWRGWLMRWLIDRNFWKVPLGTYVREAFWIVALLFASEHGPYWEVGLIAGLIYNWWIVRTKSLGDVIVAHAITNGFLCAYVIATNKWEYWL